MRSVARPLSSPSSSFAGAKPNVSVIDFSSLFRTGGRPPLGFGGAPASGAAEAAGAAEATAELDGSGAICSAVPVGVTSGIDDVGSGGVVGTGGSPPHAASASTAPAAWIQSQRDEGELLVNAI